jgi:hypothetical protein
VFTEKNSLKHVYRMIDSIRDKSIAHDVNSMKDDKTVIDLDENNSVLGICPIVVPGVFRSDLYSIIVMLVEVALSYVVKEIESCGRNVMKDAQAMTPEQRAALPPWSLEIIPPLFNFVDPRRSKAPT